MKQRYKYNESTFDITAIGCDDDSIILCINSFPLGFTVYMSGEDAQRLALQIADAAAEAKTMKENAKCTN
jgi:hypothetical protein